MIFLAHMLLGAAIGAHSDNIFLVIILAILGHYLSDSIPHIEYPIKNIEQKQWQKALPDLVRVFIDFSLALIIIFLFSKNQPIIYIGAIAGILPDGLTVVSLLFPNRILAWHDTFHEKIHYFKHKKISTFWRILTQVIVIVVCIIFLKR